MWIKLIVFLFSYFVFSDSDDCWMPPSEEKSKCPKCLKVYKNRGSLSAHLRKDCGKEREYHCAECSYSARRKNHLETHILYKHRISKDDPPAYRCGSCQKTYKNPKSLENHIRYYCGAEAQYKCSFCSYKTHREISLKSHLNLRHNVFNFANH